MGGMCRFPGSERCFPLVVLIYGSQRAMSSEVSSVVLFQHVLYLQVLCLRCGVMADKVVK
jgi:hypothetical protein